MKLVIAEKPSVAMSLAAVLGATERKDGYLEGSGYLVSWCVGHLLELAQPEAYKEQYAKWRYEDLPILPENWKYEVPKDKKKQLALLCRLMKDKRVDSVVCATDAGREGELIFRLVYEYAGCNKPMERLWISSMEDAAIREGFDHLRPGSDYDKLYDAAVCRAGADWLIGINATRLFSVLYGVTLNVGRVMSPTLALLVQRESDIESFISRPFYVPEITCGGFTASGEKMTERSEAEKIRMDCDHNSAFVRSAEKQVKTIQPPRLYDLTTLQRECNRIYGYTAQQTLDYVQSLYEKKLATYPRTDSQYLTKDMQATAASLILWLRDNMPFGKQVYLLEQCVVWQRLSVHLGWQCDNVRASYDEIPKATQDEVFSGARAFVKENKGRYECGGYIYSGEGQELGQFWAKLNVGNAKLQKTSSNTSITDGNGNYSIAGATYGVFADKDCTKQLATLTTDENGNTDVVEVKADTVYIKELSAPAGYKVDTNIYSLKVEAGKTATLNVSLLLLLTSYLMENSV